MSIENIDFFGKSVYNIIEGSVIEMKIQKRFWTKYCKIGSKFKRIQPSHVGTAADNRFIYGAGYGADRPVSWDMQSEKPLRRQ